MTKDEALKMAQDACPYTNEELRGAFYDGFIKALDQLPDTTKMIEPSITIVGWMYEDQLPEIYPYEEMFQFSVVDGVRMFPVYAPKSELYTGIDHGAWSDVPDATKWVDELRGDEEWDHPPHRNCDCKHCKEYWSDVYGAEPVAWGMVNPDGQILDVICPEEHDRAEGKYTVPLYAAPPKREWQWLTEEDIHDLFMANETVDDFGDFETIACTVANKLKEKNTHEQPKRNTDMCGND